MGRAAEGVRGARLRLHRRSGRIDHPRQGAHREIQGAEDHRICHRTPADLDRQGTQTRTAAGRMGRTREQDPVMTSTDIRSADRSARALTPESLIDDDLPNGDDLALSRATDFYSLDEL